jgi:hypothetical protein
LPLRPSAALNYGQDLEPNGEQQFAPSSRSAHIQLAPSSHPAHAHNPGICRQLTPMVARASGACDLLLPTDEAGRSQA